MTANATNRSRAARLLLISVSSLALAMPAAANDLIFTSADTAPQIGQRTTQSSGLTQIALTGGGTVSISDAAEYTINADGSIDLYRGSITVAGAGSDRVIIRMTEGLEASVSGSSSASFSVAADGEATGHTLTGEVMVGQPGRAKRSFRDGMMWSAAPGRGPRRAIANAAITQPGESPASEPAIVAIGGDAGPVGAALNGIPVTLGDGLAGAGASADIIAAGRRVEAAAQNPSLDTFPTGDLAALVAAATRLENLYGGAPFNAAQADIIRTYLLFLASGASGADFLTAYSAFLVDYLDLIRSGGVPSEFESEVANVTTINAYLAFIARSGAIANLSGDDRELAQAYLAFIADGGSPDDFAASLNLPNFAGFASSLTAYADFLANGGLPSDYTVQNIADLQAFYIALVEAGQASDRLDGDFDLLAAYFTFLGDGGTVDGFAGLPIYADYAAALSAYAQFLAAGNLPSDYTQLDIAILDAYLAALAALPGGVAGFDAIAGDQAALLNAYFDFLASGGVVDGFAGLPIYADYAAALSAYAQFLAAGNLPSDYTQLDIAILDAYLAALAALPGGVAGFDAIAGDQAALLNAYFDFLASGGVVDGFAALPVYLDYIAALNAYFAFLADGGLPSDYADLDLAIIEAYLAALDALTGGLAGFDGLNDFFVDYYAFLLDGGDPNDFAGLPGALDTDFANSYRAILQPGVSSFGPVRTASVGAGGQITTTTSLSGVVTDHAATAGVLREHGRFGNDVAFTRYENPAVSGQATNQNTHLLVGIPATSLPASGTVEYKLVGGTLPTDVFVEQGTTGSFSGRMAVAFKTVPEVGLDFDVYFGERGWNTRTAGGADDPDQQGLLVGADGRFSFTSGTELTTTALVDGSCAVSCSTRVFGSLFGDGAPYAGFAYQISAVSTGTTDARFSNVSGLAVYGQSGTALPSLGTLPDNGGDSGNGSPLLLNSPVDFTATTGVKFNLRGPSVGLSGFSVTTATFDDNQGVIAIDDSFRPRSIGTARVTDVSSNARFAIGRWTDGTYIASEDQFENTELTGLQGLHYLLAAPTLSSFVVPTTGRIDYDLIAATAPTIADGSLAPGKFEADMAILFGSTNRVAIEGQITMPRDGGDLVYSFTTEGGIANASQSTSEFRVTQGRNVNFAVLGDGITTSDNNCDANCTIQFAGYYAGEDLDQLGLTYSALTTTDATVNDKRIDGAAIFGNGSYDSGTGGDTGGTGFTGTRDPIVYYAYTNGSLASGFGGSATLEDGGLTGFQSAVGTISRGDAQVVEAGDTGDLAWARWTNGTVTDNGIFGNLSTPIGANGGYHVFAGNASTSLPASGTVDYELIGTTSATDSLGSAPGTMSGALAIQFGATSRVGFDMTMAVGGKSWTVGTTGGAANPGSSAINLILGVAGPTFSSTFNSNIGTVTGTGGACVAGCNVGVSGALYGDNGAFAGVAMNVLDLASSGPITATGLAIFGQTGASAQSLVPLAGPTASMPSDWSRWAGTSATTPNSTGSSGDAVTALSSTLAQPSPAQANTAAAPNASLIERAEQMLGGAITWGSHPAPRR